MIKGFRDFLMRGNVVDLAVAVVIGAAFTKVIEGLVDGFINPLIAAIFGKPDLSNTMTFDIHNAKFSIGLVLNNIVNFVLVAAAVYFVIVMPMQKMMERRRRGDVPADAPVAEDVALLTEIRDLLRSRNGAV